MTSKEFVLEKYPNARAEKHTQGNIPGYTKTYWLIRDGNQTMYMAEGTSQRDAWVNAKKKIENRLKENEK